MMSKKDIFSINRIEEAAEFPILSEKDIRVIFELGDRAFAENLILQYLKKAKQISIDIEANIKRKKTSDIYALANELRESSLYIGTVRISVISTFIYEHAKKRNISPLKEAANYLITTLKESDKILMELIRSGSKSEVEK